MAHREYKRKHTNSVSWTAAISVPGVTPPKKPFTRGGFETKEQAEKFARAKEQEFLASLAGISSLEEISFREFAKNYLKHCEKHNTLKYYRSKRSVIIKAMVPFFKDKKLTDIRPADIEAYVRKREKYVPPTTNKKLSAKTVSNELGILSHMLNRAIKLDHLRENPCEKVDKPRIGQEMPEHLSLRQIKQVLKFAEEHEEFEHCVYMVKFLFYTGCRRGEICHLRWIDVDLEQEMIIIQSHGDWHPKDYEARSIGICQALHKTLAEFMGWQKALGVYGKYLFPREIYGFEDFITGTMLMDAAGVEVDQPIHVWRHSFAYHMIRGGTRPAYLQQLMGHQDIRTTMSYFKLTKTDVAQQTDCLPDF
jgi:integrase